MVWNDHERMGRDTNTRGTGLDAQLVRRVRRNKWTGAIVNLAPSVFWLGVFFLAPLAVMFFFSFGQRGAFGEVLLAPEQLGLHQYRRFFVPDDASAFAAIWFTVAWVIESIVPWEVNIASQQPTPYVRLLFRSIGYGVVATVVSFVIGYPMAYYIGRIAPPKYQNLLVVLVILPFWASFLVRIYAIQLLLSANSVLMSAMELLPFVESGITLMNSRFAVLLGLVYIWVPFMILPVYSSIEEIDFTLQEAAMDLGADRISAFYHVIFPLSKPGVMAGSVLVFIPSAGAYVIPELLGGTDSRMIGNFIADQFGAAGNWPLGAAAAFILMGVMLLTIAAYQRGGGELA